MRGLYLWTWYAADEVSPGEWMPHTVAHLSAAELAAELGRCRSRGEVVEVGGDDERPPPRRTQACPDPPLGEPGA